MNWNSPEIRFEKYRLSNGLQIILHQEQKLPVIHVNLWYHVGSKNEKLGKTGFAHLFEHMMFQGSKHADGEYLTYMELAGANLREGGVNGTTSFDRTNYFETVPDESFEYVLWLESDRMGYLIDALTQEKLDNQRDVVKNERRQTYENVPYGRALEIILKNLFPEGHPYSWPVIGSQEDLTEASLEDVAAFFKTYYTPNNCSMVIAGDFEKDEVVRLVEKYFGPLEPGPALARPKLWIPRLDSEKRVTASDRVPQERLYMVWPAPAYFQSGDAELDLASRVLSQGKNSRLYKTLVYDKQIASDVSAFNYSLEICGIFGVVATARPGHSLAEIEEVISEEILRFSEAGPTEKELEQEKAKQEVDFVSALERIGGFGGKADLLNQYNTFLGSPDFLQRDYERYVRLSTRQIRDVAKQYLGALPRLLIGFHPESSERPSANKIDRSQAPTVKGRKPFHPPQLETENLRNGLTVIVVERHDLPKVAVGLVVKSGSTSDSLAKSGQAWMAAEMLDEGTSSRSALQIQEELDRLGISLVTAAESEVSHVGLEVLKKNLKPSLELMADLVLQPAFPEQELERQSKLRLDSILQERSNPPSIARKVFRTALFGTQHPFGRPTAGDEASIKSLTKDDLLTFYQTFWKPNNAALLFAGDITLREALILSEEVLGGWQPTVVPEAVAPPVNPPHSTQFYLADRQDAPQSQIRIGSIGPKRTVEDYYAIELMNAVLGGAFSSRLNMNLREDKGYTYGAFSGFSYGRQVGFWSCGAGVQTQFTRDAMVEMERELRQIRSDRPITPEELETARVNLIRGFAQRFETLGRLLDQVTEMVCFDLSFNALQQYPTCLEGISLEQAQAAASRYIDSDRMVVALVGDANEIESQVRELTCGRLTLVDVEGKPIEMVSSC